MKSSMVISLLFLMAGCANSQRTQSRLLLNETRDNELFISSKTPYTEVTAESFGFSTTKPNEVVAFHIVIPFTVHANVDRDLNGAVRVYLDEPTARQLVVNGGAWCARAGVPVNGRCSGTVYRRIAWPGQHSLLVRVAGSATELVVGLRSRRVYQVVSTNTEPMNGP